MANKKKRELLVDGDMQLYRHAYSNEFPITWDEDTTSLYINPETAKYNLDANVRNAVREAKCTRPIMCLSVPTAENFRLGIFKDYKANRAGLVRPALYYVLKDYIMENYLCVTKPSMEADDVIGILSTQYPDKYVVYSGDKDLQQIHGNHLIEHKLKYITKKEADRWFYTQILTGDVTDHYLGCPGIGIKKATAILDKVIDKPEEEIWKAIIATYAAKDLNEAYALTVARVARILRADDYDFVNKQVQLWTPTLN